MYHYPMLLKLHPIYQKYDHEHIFYHSITSLSNLLGLAKLFINEVKFVDTKGGSFRITCSKSNFQNESVTYWKIKEASIGLHEDSP